MTDKKLTPESPEIYKYGIGAFPADWWKEDKYELKENAPEKAKKIFEKWEREYKEAEKKGILID